MSCGSRQLSLLLLPVLALAQTSDYANPNLQRVLQLDESQWDRLSDLDQRWNAYLADKRSRLQQVNDELLEERLRPELDPTAFGVRFYEIAAICQESTAKFATYRQDLRAVLTSQQRLKLAALEDNLSQLPPIEEAQKLNLLTTTVRDGLQPRSFEFSTRTGWQSVKVNPNPILPGCPDPQGDSNSVFFLGGLVSFPQRYPNLTRYLNLDSIQQRLLISLNSVFQSQLGQILREAETTSSELEAESALPTPRISLLGEKAVHLEALCRQAIALEPIPARGLNRILNSTQRQLWQDLERAAHLLPILEEGQSLDLITQSPADALPPPALSSHPVRRIDWSIQYKAGPSYAPCAAIQRRTILPPFFILLNPR